MVHQSSSWPSARKSLHQPLWHQSQAEVEGYRYLPAVTWIGPGSHRYFHILGMDASFVQESWRSIVQSDWGNKIPKVLKISGKSRNSQSQGATLWLLMWNMCQNQVLSALSPADKWDSGGSTTPLTVVKIRIKTKQKKTPSHYIHLSVQNGKQPQSSVQPKRWKMQLSWPWVVGFFHPFAVLSWGGIFVIPAGEVSWARSCGCCREQQSQTHHWCSSTKAPSLTEGTNLALCILNKLLTLLSMKKWLLKSLPPHTNANDSRRTREC